MPEKKYYKKESCSNNEIRLNARGQAARDEYHRSCIIRKTYCNPQSKMTESEMIKLAEQHGVCHAQRESFKKNCVKPEFWDAPGENHNWEILNSKQGEFDCHKTARDRRAYARGQGQRDAQRAALLAREAEAKKKKEEAAEKARQKAAEKAAEKEAEKEAEKARQKAAEKEAEKARQKPKKDKQSQKKADKERNKFFQASLANPNANLNSRKRTVVNNTNQSRKNIKSRAQMQQQIINTPLNLTDIHESRAQMQQQIIDTPLNLTDIGVEEVKPADVEGVEESKSADVKMGERPERKKSKRRKSKRRKRRKNKATRKPTAS